MGSGAHRSMPAAELRQECRRLIDQVDELTCHLVRAAGEVDAANRARDGYIGLLTAAGDRIEVLELQVRDRARLVEANIGLRAALQNATAMHSLGATSRPSSAELAAAGRTTADTFEMETLTLPGADAPPAHAASSSHVYGAGVHTLRDAGARGLLRRATARAAGQ